MKDLRIASAVAAVVAVSSLVACGGGEDASTTLTVSPHAGAKTVAEVAGLEGVHSGEVEASLLVTKLKANEAISFRVDGSFARLGEESPPQLAMAASSQGHWDGRTVDFNSLLTVLPKEAALSYGHIEEEKPYEIEGPTLERLKSKFDEAQSEGGKGDVTACLEAARGLDLAQLIHAPEIEDRRTESDGTKVALISGEIDIPRLQGLLVRMLRDPDCGAQAEALGLPPAAQLEAAEVDFKKGFGPRLTLAVDRHGIIRSLFTRFECARLNGEFFELQLNFSLREVNQASELTQAATGEPVEKLLREFGTTEEAALGAEAEELVVGFLRGLGAGLSGRLP